jgi:hypothetical protein
VAADIDKSNWAIFNVTAGQVNKLVGPGDVKGSPKSVLAADGSIYFTAGTNDPNKGYLLQYNGGTTKFVQIHGNVGGVAMHPVTNLLHVVATISPKPSEDAEYYEYDPATQYGVLYSVTPCLACTPDISERLTGVQPGSYDIAFNGSGDAFITTPSHGVPATTVTFSHPAGIAFDAAGNMLIIEAGRCLVWLVEAKT